MDTLLRISRWMLRLTTVSFGLRRFRTLRLLFLYVHDVFISLEGLTRPGSVPVYDKRAALE